jgi:hypothetical protein
VQVPHWIVPPQPSPMGPQETFWAAQEVGEQASGSDPASGATDPPPDPPVPPPAPVGERGAAEHPK